MTKVTIGPIKNTRGQPTGGTITFFDDVFREIRKGCQQTVDAPQRARGASCTERPIFRRRNIRNASKKQGKSQTRKIWPINQQIVPSVVLKKNQP